jgi:hypothetical protein
MGFNNPPNYIQLPRGEAMVASQSERIQPKLAGAALALHMEMRWFVAVEAHEKEPVRPRDVLDPRHLGFCFPNHTSLPEYLDFQITAGSARRVEQIE